jgi:hypothetical protein
MLEERKKVSEGEGRGKKRRRKRVRTISERRLRKEEKGKKLGGAEGRKGGGDIHS